MSEFSRFDSYQLSLSVSTIRGELYGSVMLSYSVRGDDDMIDIESCPVRFKNLHMASNFVEFFLPYARNEYAGGKSVWPQGQRLFTVDFYSYDRFSDNEPIDDVFSALAFYGMFSHFTYEREDELTRDFISIVDDFMYRIEKAYPEAFEGDS